MNDILDSHDTHCCIEHGCKYGDDNCPIYLGIRKQLYSCEDCGLETEGYYGSPKLTEHEQEVYLNALWENKQNPHVHSPLEESLAKFTEHVSRKNLLSILKSISVLLKDYSVHDMIDCLRDIKWIK